MRGSLQGAKILYPVFCIYFAFHAIQSKFRKIWKKKISETIFEKKISKKFFKKKKFSEIFFEKCLELHETQSKSKKFGLKFFPPVGTLGPAT